jgi:hypothetical protein
LNRLRNDAGVAEREVETLAAGKGGLEPAPAVKAIPTHEQHAGARGFLAGAADERIESFAERAGTAERADSFGELSGYRRASGARLIGFGAGHVGFGTSDGGLLRFGASPVGLGTRRVGFSASGFCFGVSGVGLDASRVGFGASGLGFGASDGRELVADDARLAGDLVANLSGDLVAETVRKSIQSSLQLFVKKGQGRCRNYEVGCTPESSIESGTTPTG